MTPRPSVSTPQLSAPPPALSAARFPATRTLCAKLDLLFAPLNELRQSRLWSTVAWLQRNFDDHLRVVLLDPLTDTAIVELVGRMVARGMERLREDPLFDPQHELSEPAWNIVRMVLEHQVSSWVLLEVGRSGRFTFRHAPRR